MAILSLALLGWVAACSTSGAEMHSKMDSGMSTAKDSKMMDNATDSGMGTAKDSKMMDSATDSGMGTAKGSKMMDKQMDSSMDSGITGMFTGSEGHHAAGKITVSQGAMGKYVLTLSDIDVDKVPDGYVYLTNDGDRMHGVELGKLKQFSGTVSFDLPGGTHPENYNTVVIWCKKFNTEIGRARLAEKMM